MKSNLISKRETAEIRQTVSTEWGMQIPKVKNFNVYQITDDAQLIVGNAVKILRIKKEHLPFLTETQLLDTFPHVVVDMGAVKFVCKGADVMRPGIKNHSEFEDGCIVCVVEESQNKFLAVGRALVSSDDMKSMERGQVVRNLHYISDRYWEIGKTIHD